MTVGTIYTAKCELMYKIRRNNSSKPKQTAVEHATRAEATRRKEKGEAGRLAIARKF